MVETIKSELSKYIGKKVELIIDEGRSRKRKEFGIIKELYNHTFIIKINDINTSFSYSDLITKAIVINLV